MSSRPLDQRPIHTPYMNSHHRKKTANGFEIDATYLKRYYSVIDAEIFFGNEFVEDIRYARNIFKVFLDNHIIVDNFSFYDNEDYLKSIYELVIKQIVDFHCSKINIVEFKFLL